MLKNEMREKSIEELNDELVELKENLLKERMAFHSRQSENSAAMRNIRKDIARVKTIIKEKEIEELIKEAIA